MRNMPELAWETARFCPLCGAPLERRAVGLEGHHYPVCSACGFVLYLNPKVVVGTIPCLDGRVLLLRRNIEPCKGMWVFPGGYVDLGESLEDAARRETQEEVNLEVALDRLLGVYSFPGAPAVIIVYVARVVGGDLRSGPEAQEVRWVRPEEIPWTELAFPSTYAALKDWLDGRSG